MKLLLRDDVPPPVPLQIVYAANCLPPLRASVFMDYVAERFARIPALNEDGIEKFIATLDE